MMEQSGNPTVQPSETQALSRRELLKALAAAGGALATTAFLPSQWDKPAVEVGALPSHALATLQYYCTFSGELPREGETTSYCFEVHPPINLSVWVETKVGNNPSNFHPANVVDGIYCNSVTFSTNTAGLTFYLRVWDVTQTVIYCEKTDTIRPPYV